MSSIFMFLSIILVKLKKIWVSEIFGMTYNLGRREYILLVSEFLRTPSVTSRHFDKFRSSPQPFVPSPSGSGVKVCSYRSIPGDLSAFDLGDPPILACHIRALRMATGQAKCVEQIHTCSIFPWSNSTIICRTALLFWNSYQPGRTSITFSS